MSSADAPALLPRSIWSARRASALAFGLISLGVSSPAFAAANRVRQEIPFPNLPGFTTLHCDFHMHTVFSDGQVWPTLRVEEAWRHGLDVIAITDHNEYQRYKDDVPPKIGRAYELGLPTAKSLGLLLIRAAEITREEPPGHLNALFLKDIAAVRRDNSTEAVKSAFEQGAFIFWNHPGWKQPERRSVWYAEQEEFFRQGWLKGLEVVNGPNYDPIVHQWARERQLTMMADSDIHDLISWNYDDAGQHRPMTLVLAKEKTEEGVKEALFARRTLVFAGGKLYGDEALLKPFVQKCLEVVTPKVVLRAKSRATLLLRNLSGTALQLNFPKAADGVKATAQVEIPARAVVAIDLTSADKAKPGARAVTLPCSVANAFTAPNQPLTIEISLPVQFE